MFTNDKKIKNIFFDLDGTLLQMDLKEFEKTYLDLLCDYFYEIPKDKFVKALYEGIKAMYKNNGEKTNEEAFNYTLEINGIDVTNYEEKFKDFYEHEFKKVKKVCQIPAISKRIIDTLTNKGYTICIATNPLFPKSATFQRLSWVGIKESDVSFITTYENSSYTKPNPNYYHEILNKLNLKSEETIMFGNDVNEDGASAKAGIQTMLVSDCLVNTLNLPTDDFQIGTLEDILNFCLSLEKIN